MLTQEEHQQRLEYYGEEYLKCKYDFVYFCEKYVKLDIVKETNFQLYQKQKDLYHFFEEEKYVIITKSRQIGISTLYQAIAAHLCCFFDNVGVGIVSKDGKEASKFGRKITKILKGLPSWFGVKFEVDNKQSFELGNGSTLEVSVVNQSKPDHCLRGAVITLLIIDEAAHINKIEEALTGFSSSVATAQKHAREEGIPYGTVILSTPNKTYGIGKWFYDRWNNAISGDDIYKPYKIHWSEIPQLHSDPFWYKQQCALLGNNRRKIQQELELKFVGPDDGGFIPNDIIIQIQESCMKPPVNKMKMYAGELWLWEEPRKGAYYLIGVDTASSSGGDKSAIVVIDYQNLNFVAEYVGKLRVNDFSKVVEFLAVKYPGKIIVEITGGYGNNVIENLQESDFKLDLYKEPEQELPGLRNSIKNRTLIMDSLYIHVTEYPESIKSERAALELAALIENPRTNKVQAGEGNDDIALAMAFCYYVRQYDPPMFISMDEPKGLANYEKIIMWNEPETEMEKITRRIKESSTGSLTLDDIFGVER